MGAQGQVIILFLLILVGYTIKKLKIVTDNLNKELINLILYVSLPAFLITAINFEFSMDVLIIIGKLVLLSLGIYVFTTILSYAMVKGFKIKGSLRDVLQFAVVFSNVGFMGYPVAAALYGDIGVFYAAIYNLPFNILIWTLGVYFMTRDKIKGEEEYDLDGNSNESLPQKKKIDWKIFLNPAIIAVMIGLILFILRIKLPGPIFDTLNMIGSTTTPLAMMFIGTTLSDVNIKEIFADKWAFIISLVRLLIIPSILLFVLKVLGFDGHLLGIPVMISAMPAPASATIIATKYDNDYHLASKIVFLSTLLCIITIPMVLTII